MGAVKQFYTPPVFPDDEDKTRTARVLYALFASMMGILVLLTLANIFFFVAKTIVGILLFVLLLVILVSRALAQSGKIRVASQVFVSGLWILTTLCLLLSGQLATAAIAFHVANLAIASVLLGRRSAITLAVMSSLVGLGLVILEVTGHPLQRYFPSPPMAFWITWVIAFAMTITPLNLTLQSAAQAMARARKSERRYATLFNEAPIMSLTIRDEGGKQIITDCNAAFFKNLGYRREQVIGQPVESFYTPRSFQAFLEGGGFQRALQNEIETPIELQLVAQDGHILHALVRTAPEHDESGQTIGVLAMYLDITERKRTSDISEARLRLMQFAATHSSEELLQATLDEVEVLTGSAIGFFHFLAADQKTLILQAWSTNTRKNMCKAEGKGQHYNVDQAGVWVDCVHERRPVIHNDYPALPASRRKGMPAGHAPVTRELAVPVFRGDKIVSILGVGNKPRAYDQTDVEIVSRLADMAWDIAERKQAEERTAKEHENFLKIFTASPVGLVLLDREMVITQANPSTSEIMLRDPIEILGKRAGGGLGCINSLEDTRGCGFGRECPHCILRQGLEKILTGGQSIHGAEVELTLLIKGKLQPRWLSIGAEPLELEGKRHVVVAIDDITERKRAEEALRDSLQLLKKTFASLRDAVFVIDAQKSVVSDCNPAATEIFGYSRAEMVGNTTLSLHIDQASLEEFRRLLSSAIAEKGFLSLSEFNMKRKDGTVFPTENTVLPLKDEQDQQIGWVSVVRDITERKQAQEEEEKLREQLSQAQKMESVGRLAGGVAHDFNNMLQVILGCAEMALRKSDPDNRLHAYLNQIHKAGVRSADLTGQLLAFSRRQAVSPRVLDLNEAVEGMLNMLRRLIGEDIDLVWLPRGRLEPVFIDPSQVDQVLVNLCVNARDAISGMGKITIETDSVTFGEDDCATHPGFVAGEYVLLAVSDDGCGISPETEPNIFEPFFTTKEVGKGTGLGLATVHGIVNQNNGVINVDSEPGHGTTFRVYLPRHEAKAASHPEKKHAQGPALGSAIILLVEDEASTLKMTKLMLEEMGHTVVAAETPREAISLAREHKERINLLMTDVIMPEMNGRDLSNKLMSICPDIKCLFMSGYTTDVIDHHGVLEEGVHFIQKPFSMKDLAAKTSEAMND